MQTITLRGGLKSRTDYEDSVGLLDGLVVSWFGSSRGSGRCCIAGGEGHGGTEVGREAGRETLGGKGYGYMP
jgi:hypothetical protein